VKNRVKIDQPDTQKWKLGGREINLEFFIQPFSILLTCFLFFVDSRVGKICLDS
jgi:hypothetical protein